MLAQPNDVTTFLLEYLDLPTATGDPDARWEPFQLEYLLNPTSFRSVNKTRQAGWSWIMAAEAVAKRILSPRSGTIFVSINLGETKEKIRYARHCIDALDRDVRPRLLTDNATELEIANGSRIISHACRPVRGKGNMDVRLDEFAHYAQDTQIYISALPVLTRGNGDMRLGSTPMGAHGMFWEIHSQQLRPYPGYVRRDIPWWVVMALCTDVEEALREAPKMETSERVYAYGSEALIQIYENMPEDYFQQEYECEWMDESVAWIGWDVIKRCQADDQAGRLWHRAAVARGDQISNVMQAIDEVAQAIQDGRCEDAMCGGMDVGRRKHLSEITLLGKGKEERLKFRLGLSLDNLEFDDQEAVIGKIMDTLPVHHLAIDENGIGMQMAERMHKRYGDKIGQAEFTQPSKETWAVNTKHKMQQTLVSIPTQRDLSYQIHSIKRRVTAAKNPVYDVAANEKHHADKFWALALAIDASGVTIREPNISW